MKGFTFFENFFESISDERNGLTPAQEGEVYRAILYYVFRGEELPLEGVCRMAFNLIRPSLDISRVRSAARRSAEKSVAEESDINGGTNENQNEIKTQSNANQTRMKSENLTFLEETETERSVRKKEIYKKTSIAGAREGGESHEDVMDDLGVPSLSAYREKLREFLKMCYLNGHIVPNEKLRDIISRLDAYHGDDEAEKVRSLQKAISGGFFDVEELRLADPLDRISWRES